MKNRRLPRRHGTARRLLSFLKRFEEEYALSAELENEFRLYREKRGAIPAFFWYWGQVISAVPVYIHRSLRSGGILFLNNLKIAFRQIQKHPGYSLINLLGLGVGLACCLLVILFVQAEKSFDSFHANADRIFRVSQNIHRPAGDYYSIRVPSWIGPGLVENLPEVDEAVRIVRWGGIISSGDKRFSERLFFADPSFFTVFTFPLSEGHPETALSNPDSVIITRKTAEKYFGTGDALGKTLTLDGEYDMIVSGLLEDFPGNSHIQIDILAPYTHTRRIYGEERDEGRRIMAYTYLLLNNRAASRALKEKLPAFVTARMGEDYAAGRSLDLMPLKSIHLNSHTSVELEKNSRIQYSYILTAVAGIVLLIAFVNYINLSTARACRRAKEVGVRKASGANRHRLIRQFIGESVVFSILAHFLALVLAWGLLPLFNAVLDRNLSINLLSRPLLYLGFLSLALLVGTAAGAYPALLLASFQPAEIVKGRIGKTRLAGLILRKGLVVFQFSLALVFITGMLVVNRQMEFIRNKDLGFNRDRVVVLPPPLRLEIGYDGFKSGLLENPAILEATASTGNPGLYPGLPFNFRSAEDPESEVVRLDYTAVDFDYFDFLGIQLLEGRAFSKSIPSDAGQALVLNESAVKRLGWESPLGRTLSEEKGEISGRVIGVIKDFHNVSLHERIQPAVFQVNPRMFGQIAVRIAPGKTGEALEFLKRKWAEWAPYNIFYSSFLENDLDGLYSEDQKAGLVFKVASALSILIACLGLLGLSVHVAEQRTKEIGIRKTLGASAAGIVRLLCRDFVLLILLADILAWPVVYYVMRRWLRNFVYHASLPVWLFVLGGGIALAVALLTVGFHAFKAATADPVKTLRYE